MQYEDPNLNQVGWRYQGDENPSRKPPIRRSLSDEQIPELGLALRRSGFQHDRPDDEVAMAVAGAIAGVRSTKGKSRAASPMTPALALLQNPEGMTGARNPANYASILDALFRLGSGTPGHGVAELWLRAAEARVRMDPVLGAIDSAFSQVRSPYVPKPGTEAAGVEQGPGWVESPFGWFNDSWQRLTSSEWVSALPPRVWTDWATTVLRLALAMGFLWECERYSRVCRAAMSGHVAPSLAAVPLPNQPFELVPWPDASLPPSSRNVRSIIRRKVYEGGRLRNLLVDEEKRLGGGDLDATLATERFRSQVRGQAQ